MYYRLTADQFTNIPTEEYDHAPTYNLAGTECILHIESTYVPPQFEQQFNLNTEVKEYWNEHTQEWIEDFQP